MEIQIFLDNLECPAIMTGHIPKICPTGQIGDEILLLNDWTMSLLPLAMSKFDSPVFE